MMMTYLYKDFSSLSVDIISYTFTNITSPPPSSWHGPELRCFEHKTPYLKNVLLLSVKISHAHCKNI